MYMTSDIIKITNDTHTNLKTILYGRTVSEKFFEYYRINEHKTLEAERTNYLYIKMRRLILLALLRFKSIFNSKSIELVYTITDIVQKYLISFFISQGRPITSDIENLFAKIYLDNDDYVVVDSINSFYKNLFVNKFSVVTIENSAGTQRNFIDTTLIDAVIQILSDNIIGWSPLMEVNLKGYKESFSMDFENNSVNIPYYSEYEFQVYDVLENLLNKLFNETEYSDMLYKLYNPEWKETDRVAETIRRNLDILYILEGVPDSTLLKVLQSGQVLSTFSIKNYIVDNPDIVSDFDDILYEIPNLKANLSFSFGTGYDGEFISVNLTGSDVKNLDVTTDESEYNFKIKSLYDVCSSIKVNFLNEVNKQIDSFVYDTLKTISKVKIPQTELISIATHLKEKVKSIADQIDFTQIEFDIQWYDVDMYFKRYITNTVYNVPKKYYEKLVGLFNTYFAQIKQDFDNLLADYGKFEYPLNFKFILDTVTSRELQSYDKYLHDISKKLDLGYCVMDFESRFRNFVNLIYDIIKPVLRVKVPEEVQSVASEILSTLFKDFVINLLPVFYFDIVSPKLPYYEENMLYGLYSNYSNINYNLTNLLFSILNGFKPVIYDEKLLEYALNLDTEKYVLDINMNLSVYLLPLKDQPYYIDFTRGEYRILESNPDLLNLLRELNYSENIVLNQSIFSNFSSRYKVYPYENTIYKKSDDIIMFNYNDFLKISPGNNYYLQYKISQFLPNAYLDKLIASLEDINNSQYSINIIVTDLSENLIRARARSFDYTLYSTSFYMISLRVKDIIKSDVSGRYILDKYSRIINTDIDFEGNIINDYYAKKDGNFNKLDMIDPTGRDLVMLQYNYRLYLTLQSLLKDTKDLDDEFSKYEIILTSNISDVKSHIVNSKNNPILTYIINNYMKV